MKHNAKNFIDRTGQKVGCWFVVSLHQTGKNNTQWLCQCTHCGEMKVWRYDQIYIQNYNGRYLCPCRKNTRDVAREEVKSLKISEAKRAANAAKAPPTIANDPPPTPVRISTQVTETPKGTGYRKKVKWPDKKQGEHEAWAYSRNMECRGMTLYGK